MEPKEKKERKATLGGRIWARVLKLFRFICNPRLFLCLGIAWMITNGWSYVLLGLGTVLESGWMIGIAGSYLAMLWFPFTPEKVLTVIIAIWLMTRLFPDDQKTLAVLREELRRAREAVKGRKKKKSDSDSSSLEP